jgi:hypothetical protein
VLLTATLTAIQGLNEERRKEEPMNIGTLPTRHARWRPDHIAVVFEDQPLTWRQFNQRVEARYQRVHSVEIMDDVPLSTAGKTLKRIFREPYWAGRTTRIQRDEFVRKPEADVWANINEVVKVYSHFHEDCIFAERQAASPGSCREIL